MLPRMVIHLLLASGLVLAGAGMGEAAAALPRSTTDRPDEVAGRQVHVFYVLPSDGVDREFDTPGTLGDTVAAFRDWLAAQADGQTLRLDTFEGEPDITFRRMGRTDADVRAEGAFVRETIEEDLDAAGFDDPDKLYAV